jgi:putative ABC transport system permease protein
VRVLGGFLPRLRGVTGRLAAENVARSPKRTAATASAIVIGVALIGFITAFASSAKASVSRVVDTQIDADVIVQPSGGFFGGFSGFSPEVARTIGDVPAIDQLTTFAGTGGRVTYPDGDTTDTFVGAVDPTTYGALIVPAMEEGDFESLRPGGAIVDKQIADDHDLDIGDRVGFRLAGGGQLELEIQAISRDPFALSPTWTVTFADFDPVVSERLDVQVFATVADGADVGDTLDTVETAIERFPDLEVLDREGFKSDLAEQLQQFVTVIYALLGLSIVIAMIGVANTISLSVHERTRELGLLRAVGMVRRQLKSMIRWEAVLIAVLGTVVGLALGIVTSYAMIQALEGFGLTEFDLPVGSLLVQVAIAAALAVVASLLPARRAARLDVLKAIAAE